MRSCVSLTLVAALLLGGCSATPGVFRSALRTRPAESMGGQGQPVTPREVVRKIPLGTNVVVKTVSGEKIRGKLRAVDDNGVAIEKPAVEVYRGGDRPERIPPSTVEVSYDNMRSIDKGMGRGTKAAIIALVVGGIILAALIGSWGAIQQAS